eukprot:bmy_09852T0
MLFMCSRSIIHSLNDEQDIRKTGGLFKAIPFTTASLIIRSLALTGMPFLTGFYSNDLIIETANTPYTTLKFFALLGQPRFSTLTRINENNPLLIKFIKRLLIGSVFAGFFISSNISATTIPQILSNYHTLSLTISKSINKSKINITTVRSDLIRKCATKIYLTFPNKNVYTSPRPKRPKVYFLSFLITFALSIVLFNFHE